MGQLVVLAILIWLGLRVFASISTAWNDAQIKRLEAKQRKLEKQAYNRLNKMVGQYGGRSYSPPRSAGVSTQSAPHRPSPSARPAPQQDFQQRQAARDREAAEIEAQSLERQADSEEMRAAGCRSRASELQSRSSSCISEASRMDYLGDRAGSQRVFSEAHRYEQEAAQLTRDAQAAEQRAYRYRQMAREARRRAGL